MGLKLGKWIQNSFTFTKTAALLGLIVLGLCAGVQPRQRGLDLVDWWNPVGQRLEAGDGLARLPSLTGPFALPLPVRPGDDRAPVLAVGLEQRDLHRGRDPQPGPHASRGP